MAYPRPCSYLSGQSMFLDAEQANLNLSWHSCAEWLYPELIKNKLEVSSGFRNIFPLILCQGQAYSMWLLRSMTVLCRASSIWQRPHPLILPHSQAVPHPFPSPPTTNVPSSIPLPTCPCTAWQSTQLWLSRNTTSEG